LSVTVLVEKMAPAPDNCLLESVKITLGAEHAMWGDFVVEFLQEIKGTDDFLDDFAFRILHSSPRHLGKGPFLEITSVKMSTHATSNDMGALQYVRSRIEESNNPVFDGHTGARITDSLVGDCPSSAVLIPLYDSIILETWREEKARQNHMKEERLQKQMAKTRVPYWVIMGVCVATVVIGVIVCF